MKYFRIGFFVLFSFLLLTPAFSQTGKPEETPGADIAKIRTDRIKADILPEIESFSRKEQAVIYANFGEILLGNGQKDGAFWLAKGVEIALNPATAYHDEADKLSCLWNVLHHVLKNDAALADKLIVHLKQIKIDESNEKVSERANKTYIVIAEQLLSRKKDEKSAFEFAMNSLKGKKPAVNWDSSEFFRHLKNVNEDLANAYFARLIEILKTTNDARLISDVVHYFALSTLSNYPVTDARFRISETQKKALIELLLPAIQKDAEALAGKKATGCGAVLYWGLTFSEDYQRLLPEKFPVVEQALNICQNAAIEFWKKPDFLKKPRKTSQDWLALAKEVTDKSVQANYLRNAESFARKEQNYRLSESILESIDQNFRHEYWKWAKIETTAKLFEEIFKKDDFAGAAQFLENLPPEYRPFVVLIWLERQYISASDSNAPRKNLVFEAIRRARADFNKMNPVPQNPREWSVHPTKFAQLTRYYVKFGLYEEAVGTHTESVGLLNRYVAGLPEEYKKNDYIPRFGSYSTFTNQFPPNDTDFVNKYFEQIYANINKIENSKIRLYERMYFLEKNLKKVPVIPSFPYTGFAQKSEKSSEETW